MFQKRDLGFDARAAGKTAKIAGAENAVAGDDDRDRIAAAGLPNGLGRNTKRFGEVSVSSCFPKWNFKHGGADLFLQVRAMDFEGQVEGLSRPIEISRDLLCRVLQERGGFGWAVFPSDTGDRARIFGQCQGSDRGFHGQAGHAAKVARKQG